MNKCPYCGSDVSSEAQFCTACMRSLVEKRDVTPKVRNTGKAVVGVLCALLLVASVSAAVIVLRAVRMSDATGKSVSEGEGVSEGPAPSEQAESLMMCATYVTGNEGYSYLWSPREYVHTHTLTDGEGAEWAVYNIPVKIDGAVMRVFICGDGRVLTTVSGLGEDTLEQGETVASLMTVALYSDRYGDGDKAREAVLGAQITEQASDTTVADLLGLHDYAAKDYSGEPSLSRKVFDIGDHGEYKAQSMVIEHRSAPVDGGTLYDVTVLHSFE